MFPVKCSMKKLAFIISLYFISSVANASINVNIYTPTINQLTDSMLEIRVAVISTYDISTITATVADRQMPLTFNQEYQEFRGGLSLAGLKKGDTLTLAVLAKDVFNTEKTATQTFIYAPPPKLSIEFPLHGTNAYPSIRIKANATASAGPCALHVSIFATPLPVFDMSFFNTVDTVITIPSSAGNLGNVAFDAMDQWGQHTPAGKEIFYNNNPFFTEVYRGNGRLYDFNYNKILEINDYRKGAIVDFSSNTAEEIKGADMSGTSPAFLTQNGAMFSTGYSGWLQEWSNDSIYQIGYSYGGKDLFRTKGKYVTRISNSQNNILFRNLETHTDTPVANVSNYPGFAHDLTAEGMVVYSDLNGNITTNRGTGNITNDYPNINTGPVTDGNNFVYLKQAVSYGFSIFFSDGQTETELAYLGNDFSPPYYDYAINNKYIAYSKPGNAGQMHIWLRDSAGTNTQKTFFGTTSQLEVLGANGDIVFFAYNSAKLKRYFVSKDNPQPKELGEKTGVVYYRNNNWYVMQGRYLYKLNVNAFTTLANGNWTDASSWENNVLPAENADVIIRNNIIVDANITCKSLKVVPPGSITVLPGFNLTVLQ